jgi:molecular chaperone GrpE
MDSEKKSATSPQEEAMIDSGREVAQENGAPVMESGGAPSGPGLSHEQLAVEHEKLVAEKKDLFDRLLRKQAELENVRKRVQREKEEFRQLATEDLIRSLLPTLDGFERALSQRDAGTPEAFYQGLELIYKELREVLGRAGLEPIETEGALFDPHLHQAVETVESDSHRDQEIVEELQRGYKLRHRLLRPAIVRVAVKSRSAVSAPQPEERD